MVQSLARSLFDNGGCVVQGHDRYLIYRMLGRKVSFGNPSRRAKYPVCGVVRDVSRNIFSNEVELTVDGRLFSFKEPRAIVQRGDDVVFLYGDVGMEEQSDEEVYMEMRMEQFKGGASDVLARERREPTTETKFEIGESVPLTKPKRKRKAA